MTDEVRKSVTPVTPFTRRVVTRRLPRSCARRHPAATPGAVHRMHRTPVFDEGDRAGLAVRAGRAGYAAGLQGRGAAAGTDAGDRAPQDRAARSTIATIARRASDSRPP